MRVGSLFVAPAPESYVENPTASPSRGMLIALVASLAIWAGIAALIF